ncbi:reverse transcriptase domain-containing protein, partial [Tanacetum coccineum]
SSDPESIIQNRRRNLCDPSLLFDFEEINMNPNNVQGPPPAGPNLQNPPAPDLRTMEELLQAPTDGVGDAIVVPLILANQFELKIGLLNLVTTISFHGFANDDPHSHIRSEAWDRFKDLLNKCPQHGFSPLHQIDMFYNGLNQSDQDSLNSIVGGNLLTRNTQETLTIIKNKYKVQTLRNKPQVSSASGSGSSSQNDAITALAKQVEALISSMNKPIYSIQEGCKTCGGPHSYYECQAADGYTQDVYATTRNYNSGGNSYQPQGNLPSPPSSSSKEAEREPKTIMDQVLLESTTRVPPPVVQPSPELPPSPSTSFVILERNPHQPPIPYPSSFPEALAYMLKYAKMVKDLLTNKEKLLELVNTSFNENCSAVLLKKLLKKLGDTKRFLIPCDFHELESCMALDDLGASINLMPLSVWKKLILPELTPTRMTLKLATQTVAYPAGIAEDVFVTAYALVNVHGEGLTLRVGDEKLVFNVESTSKYPRKHGDESIHMIDILDTTCEDYFHKVLNVQKSIHPLSGSPTPSSNPVVESLSPSLTPFGDNDFLLEETDAFLSLDDSIPPVIDNGIYNSEGDILFLE